MSDSAPHTLTSILAHVFDADGTLLMPITLSPTQVATLTNELAALSPTHPDYARAHTVRVLWAAQHDAWDQMRTLIPPLNHVDWPALAGNTLSWQTVHALADVAHEAGGLSLALTLHQQRLAWQCAQPEDAAMTRQIIATSHEIGTIQQRRKQLDAAAHTLGDALTRARQLVATHNTPADSELLSRILVRIGTIAQDRQRYDEALAAYQEDYRVTHQLASQTHSDEHIRGLGLAISNLAHLAILMRNAPQAKAWFTEHLELCQQHYARQQNSTNRAALLGAQINMGRIDQSMGNHADAIQHYMESLKTAHQLLEERGGESDRRTIALIYTATAASHQQTGNIGAALESLGEALQMRRRLSETLSQRRDVALTLAQMGGMYQHIRNLSAAKSAFHEATDIRRTLVAQHHHPADLRELALVLSSLGRLAAQTGDHAQATQLAKEAYQVAQQAPEQFQASEISALHQQAQQGG